MKQNIQAVHNPLKGNQHLNVSEIHFPKFMPIFEKIGRSYRSAQSIITDVNVLGILKCLPSGPHVSRLQNRSWHIRTCGSGPQRGLHKGRLCEATF